MNQIEQIRKYMDNNRITKSKMAKLLGMPSTTFRDLLKGVKKPKSATEQKISDFFEQPQSVKKTSDDISNTERIERVKHILLLLEIELRHFIKDEEARKLLREKINFADIGYLSSLLNMLSEEGMFKRWKSLTSNEFNFLRKG